MYEKGKQVFDYKLNKIVQFVLYCWKLVLVHKSSLQSLTTKYKCNDVVRLTSQ